jgi:hypothetical protein
MDDKISIDYKRRRICDGLAKCTDGQLNMFNQMYPNGPTDQQLDRAIDQIERTIVKNEAKS